MIPSLEVWPTIAKEAHSPHELRLAPLDTNPIFTTGEVFNSHALSNQLFKLKLSIASIISETSEYFRREYLRSVSRIYSGIYEYMYIFFYEIS